MTQNTRKPQGAGGQALDHRPTHSGIKPHGRPESLENAGWGGVRQWPEPPVPVKSLNPPESVENEPVNSKLTADGLEGAESTLLITFGVKVPFSLYRIYSEELMGRQKRFVREAVRQFFASLVRDVRSARADVRAGGSCLSLNVNINVANAGPVPEASDVWAEERIKQLRRKLKEAHEVLEGYRVKTLRYDKIVHYARLFRAGTIDAKSFLNQVLKAVESDAEA